MKLGKNLCCLLIVIVLLSACTSAPATEPFPTIAAPTLTPVPPTSTVIPTDTALAPTPIPVPSSLPFVALEGLRVAYIIDGNLFVQDSDKQAIQLTHNGQDHEPMFSDDGQKIMFYREGNSNKREIWTINANGSGEQALVNLEKLASFGQEYDETTEFRSPAFIPTTHQLLFTTTNQDLLVANTDTGELKQLLAPGQSGFFLVSPNGKWIAVQTLSRISVIDSHGQIVRQNMASYSYESYDCVFYGYICAPMFWKQDSSELIVLQPLSGVAPLMYALWRYPMDGRPGTEIRFSPPPMGEALSVSPDGKWIAYSLFEQGDGDGVYLGNLSDGTSQLIYQPKLNETTGVRDPAPLDYYGWSPDSLYFVFSDDENKFISNIHGETTLLGKAGVLGWIDNNHYFSGSTVYEVGGQDGVPVVDFPPFAGRFETPMAFVFLGSGAIP
jgi:hypothetical protein